MQSRTRQSAKNAVIGLLTQVITLILSFVLRTVFINYLAVEYLGINGLFSNVLTLLSFAELGIGEALVYAMYKPMRENDVEKLRKLLAFYKRAYTIIALSVLAVGIFLSFFVDFFVAEKPDIPENFQFLFLLFLVNNVLSYFLVYKQSVLLVDQRKYVVSLINQLIQIIQIVLQLVLLIATRNYILFLFVMIAATATNNIILSIYVNKKYKWVRYFDTKEKLTSEERKTIFNDIKALSISKIAGVVSNGSDNIVIAKIVGIVSVGLVSNYSLIINSINKIAWQSLSSVTGSFGNFNVDSTEKRRNEVFNELYLATFWIYGFITICLLVLLNPFISVWLGDRYFVNLSTVFALVLITYVSGMNFPTYTFRVTSGLFDEIKYNYVLFAITNILLSIILGIKLGLAGVYFATIISRIACVEIKEAKIVCKKVLNISLLKFLMKYTLSFALVVVSYLFINNIIKLITLNGIVGFVLKAITCVFLVNGIFIIMFFRTKEFRALLNRANSIFIRR